MHDALVADGTARGDLIPAQRAILVVPHLDDETGNALPLRKIFAQHNLQPSEITWVRNEQLGQREQALTVVAEALLSVESTTVSPDTLCTATIGFEVSADTAAPKPSATFTKLGAIWPVVVGGKFKMRFEPRPTERR